jgi:hypothetical protein
MFPYPFLAGALAGVRGAPEVLAGLAPGAGVVGPVLGAISALIVKRKVCTFRL